MLDSSDPNLSPRKRRVLEFMEGVLHGERMDMLETYVSENYIQHTPGVGQGREGIRSYYEQVASKRPNRNVWRPIMMIEEGDIVVLFKWMPNTWICDIMRFDENDMLAEHWDVVQAWPDGAPDPTALSEEDMSRFAALFNLPGSGN